MDFVKNLSGGNSTSGEPQQQQQQGSGGLMGSVNNALGGGQSGENKEDLLDKGVDYAQQYMGGGQQNNENAVEQAKDEQISDAIRRGYKSTTGGDFPIADK